MMCLCECCSGRTGHTHGGDSGRLAPSTAPVERSVATWLRFVPRAPTDHDAIASASRLATSRRRAYLPARMLIEPHASPLRHDLK